MTFEELERCNETQAETIKRLNIENVQKDRLLEAKDARIYEQQRIIDMLNQEAKPASRAMANAEKLFEELG